MPRPKLKNPTVSQSVRIPITTRAELETEAYKRGMDVGSLVREILEERYRKAVQLNSL
jgi:hypothetical protein